MPKVALLSDIHSNLAAFEAVLEDVAAADVDDIYFGGDTVGYAARPNDCVNLVRQAGGKCVLGNHDYYTNSLRQHPDNLPASGNWRGNPVWAGVVEAVKQLSEENAAWLAALPDQLEIPGAILSHSSLHEPEEWPYLHSLKDAEPTLRILRGTSQKLGFFGHTHRQSLFFDPFEDAPKHLGSGRYHLPHQIVCAVVVGSVGQPRDGDLRASWTLWDSDERILEFRRTEYPAMDTARQIVEAGLPIDTALRLLNFLQSRKLKKLIASSK